MRKITLNVLCAFILVCVARRAESAQTTPGTVYVHVQDKRKIAISDAEVVITDVKKGSSYHERTDNNGNCRFDVPAGKYKVKVTAGRLSTFLDVEVGHEQVPLLVAALEQAPLQSTGGYIDSAIISSQIRIRFDAGFHVDRPDRAEFFYAQYAGLNGPGPPFVVADLNFQQLYLQAEYAPRKRLSFFTEVPVRWIQPQLTVAAKNPSFSPPFPQNVNVAGLSDVAAGFKVAAVASSDQYLTFQFQAYFPSGDASKGLGTNHYSVEPALLYYRRLSDRLALEAQVGDSHPIGGSSCPQPCIADPSPPGAPASGGFAGDVFFYGVGPSYVLYRGENVRIAPVVELVGWRVLGGLETMCVPNVPCSSPDGQEGVSADGTNIVNLKVGARTSIGRHNSFYVGFGHAVTRSHWYEEIVRAEYRYSF